MAANGHSANRQRTDLAERLTTALERQLAVSPSPPIGTGIDLVDLVAVFRDRAVDLADGDPVELVVFTTGLHHTVTDDIRFADPAPVVIGAAPSHGGPDPIVRLVGLGDFGRVEPDADGDVADRIVQLGESICAALAPSSCAVFGTLDVDLKVTP